jgi:hypothetical protein
VFDTITTSLRRLAEPRLTRSFDVVARHAICDIHRGEILASHVGVETILTTDVGLVHAAEVEGAAPIGVARAHAWTTLARVAVASHATTTNEKGKKVQMISKVSREHWAIV